MIILSKRSVFTEDSDSEQEHVRPSISSICKPPQLRNDSGTYVDDIRLQSPYKGTRQVVLVDDDEDEEMGDLVNCSANTQTPAKNRDREMIVDPESASRVGPATASTLRIPPELILTVLQHADPAEMLDLRLISRGIKMDIDTHVLYHKIQRVELIGYLGPKHDQLFEHLDAKEYWDFAFVRATFDRLDDQPGGNAVWEPKGAHFRIATSWFDAFARIGGEFRSGNAWWDHMRQCLDLGKTPAVYGQLRWCVKVGPAVFDLGIGDEDEIDIQLIKRDDDKDDESGDDFSIRVTDWKHMLMNVFREERALRSLMKDTREDQYTYNHLEDSLRAMRRKHFLSKLDERDRNDCRNIWKIENMIPLWGKHTYFSNNRDHVDVEHAERNAVQTLMLLRKEASVSSREPDALNTIVVERATVRKELEKVDQLFKQ